jgi:hypothetical protein
MDANESSDAETLDRLNRTIPAMDVAIAGKLLIELKRILDGLGIVFFLRQGTCLGAVRDHAFIPWDDDLDLGIVIGLHGFTEASIDPLIKALRDNGYYVKVEDENSSYVNLALLKENQKTDLYIMRVVDGKVYHYPGVWFPTRLFTNLKETPFIGSTFLVPNPPEEYLKIKYGPDWVTPKQIGYEKDVLVSIGEGFVPGPFGRIKRFVYGQLFPGRTTWLRILNDQGVPVHGAEVAVLGVGRFRTNRHGYAKLYPQHDDVYAVTVNYDDHEEVLYEEELLLGTTYVYQPDPSKPAGRFFVLSPQ